MKFFKPNRYPKHLEDQDLSPTRQIFIFTWEVFKVVVISLAIIIPVRYYLIKPFYVKGASMEPTFYDHEYLIIDELNYRFNQPQRGDVAVFRYPDSPDQFFIKRIIGLPEERVVVENGQIYIYNQQNPNGVRLDEDYLPAGLKTNGQADVTLTASQYYLMGDNRNSSLDSRIFGPVDQSYLIGRVIWRGWPISKMGFLFNKIGYNL